MRRGILWGEEITTRPTYGSPMRALGPLVEKARRLPPIVLDGAIGAGLLAATLSEALGRPASEQPLALAALAAFVLSVTLRRTKLPAAWALLMLAGIVGRVTHNGYTGGYGLQLAGLVLVYSVAERCSARTASVALITWTVAYFILLGRFLSWNRLEDISYYGFALFPWIGVAWFAGRAQARGRAITVDLGRNTRQLREERDLLARSAVSSERAHIAQDLQALVLRGVKQMNAETRQARRLLTRDPGRACASIGAIEAEGRDTLVEMRRLLAVLRARADAATTKVHGSMRSEQPPVHLLAESAAERKALRMGGRWGRTRRWIVLPWVTDALVVLALAAEATAEPFLGSYALHTWRDVTFIVVIVGALLFRRVAPIVVLIVAASATFVWYQFPGGGAWSGDMALAVAVYTVAVLRGAGWGVVAIGIVALAYTSVTQTSPAGLGYFHLEWWMLGWTLQFGLVLIFGIAVRTSRELNDELTDQTEVLGRTREERVRLAVVEERTRIAREIHDLVAHGVTLMVIQAGAARWLAESDPLRADQALGAVELAGQEAFRELRSLVGSLDGVPLASAMPPIREQLTIRSLVDQEIAAGMRVELFIDGEPRRLDGGVKLSLYRIVQEALTNVRRHAPGARTRVALRFTLDGVEVEVTDGGGNGNGHRQTVPGAGQGLVGIAERAALFGGHAEAGPTSEGGFRVQASLHQERVLV
jgi:signal transduction histidine kinase